MDIAVGKDDLLMKNDPKNYQFRTWFRHYTSKSNANTILLDKCFQVRNLKVMNDCSESIKSKEMCEKVFALCFCNTNSDMIPMWYLYSGISGDGISLGISSKQIKEFIDGINEVKAIIKNKDSEESSEQEITLKRGDGFNLNYGSIFYRKILTHNEVKYRNKWYKITDGELPEADNFFIKDYPWFYENEFRITFTTDEPFDYLEVEIPDEMYKDLQIRVAPEYNDSMLNELLALDGFKRFMREKFIKSKLGVKFGLLQHNMDSFIEYVKELIIHDPNCKQVKRLKDILEIGYP